MEPESQKPSFPEDYEELRTQVQQLNQRVSALERGLVARPADLSAAPRQNLGLTLVNRVGAITLALGVLFFFKYAADNNWIGPAARIVLGLVAATLLVVFGEFLQRRSQRVLAQGITACGLATGYLAFYASAAYYHLLLDAASLVAMAAVVILIFVLALRRRQQTLAGFGVAAAALTIEIWHQLFSSAGQAIWLFVVAAGTTGISVTNQWPPLLPLSLSITLAAALVLGLTYGEVVLLFGLLAGVCWTLTARLRSTDRMRSMLYVCGHAGMAVSLSSLETWLIGNTSMALTVGSILLACYGVVLLAIGVARASYLNRGIGLGMIGLVVVKLYLYDVWNLNYGFRITAFVVLGILLLIASFVYSRSASSIKR